MDIGIYLFIYLFGSGEAVSIQKLFIIKVISI